MFWGTRINKTQYAVKGFRHLTFGCTKTEEAVNLLYFYMNKVIWLLLKQIAGFRNSDGICRGELISRGLCSH